MSEEKRAPVTKIEKIPPKILAEMNKAQEELNEANKEFFQLSTQLVGEKRRLNELYSKRESNAKKIQKALDRAAKKRKLEQQTAYKWRYDPQTASFIGISYTAPEPPKPVETPIEEPKTEDKGE